MSKELKIIQNATITGSDLKSLVPQFTNSLLNSKPIRIVINYIRSKVLSKDNTIVNDRQLDYSIEGGYIINNKYLRKIFYVEYDINEDNIDEYLELLSSLGKAINIYSYDVVEDWLGDDTQRLIDTIDHKTSGKSLITKNAGELCKQSITNYMLFNQIKVSRRIIMIEAINNDKNRLAINNKIKIIQNQNSLKVINMSDSEIINTLNIINYDKINF
jgi:hypothetical protein